LFLRVVQDRNETEICQKNPQERKRKAGQEGQEQQEGQEKSKNAEGVFPDLVSCCSCPKNIQ